MFIRVRFAPSPTGPLHLGSLRTALYNYLFAKKFNGSFILRLEDTDELRFNKTSLNYIINSLKWLGIEPNEGWGGYGGNYAPYEQSKRLDIYRKYLDYLLYYGFAYYAFDSLEDLYNIRLHNKDFVYNSIYRNQLNNSCNISSYKVIENLDNNIPYVVRFKTPDNLCIEINDLIKGKIIINSNILEDKIIMKSNGGFTYHFANVVDDHVMKITHVIRGEEWISSTPLHILIYQAFNWKIPNFAHLPLILNINGKGKLSKRYIDNYDFPLFPLSWNDKDTNKKYLGFKEQGYLPEAVLNFIFILGWKNIINIKNVLSLCDMCKIFDFKYINKSSVRFDLLKLKWFNKQCINLKPDKYFLNHINQELLKRNILIYNKDYICYIFSLVKNRIIFIHDLWYEIKYFFICPDKYVDDKINHLKKIYNIKDVLNYLINFFKNIKIINFTYNILRCNINDISHIINKRHHIMQILRICIIGDLRGLDIILIIVTIGKLETIKRINNYLSYCL